MPARAMKISRSAVAVGGSTVYRTKRRFVEGNLELPRSEEPAPRVPIASCRAKEEARSRWRPRAPVLQRACALDAGVAGRRDGQAHRASGPVPRDGSPPRLAETTSSRGAGHVVHSQGRRHLCRRAWRTCSTSTLRCPIRSGRWCASTRARPSSSARHASRFRPDRGSSSVMTTNIGRNGTVNLFVFLDARRSWRTVKVTEHRAARDFAEWHARARSTAHYPQAEQIPRRARQSVDPLRGGDSTRPSPPRKHGAVLRRLEFRYTPKTRELG